MQRFKVDLKTYLGLAMPNQYFYDIVLPYYMMLCCNCMYVHLLVCSCMKKRNAGIENQIKSINYYSHAQPGPC